MFHVIVCIWHQALSTTDIRTFDSSEAKARRKSDRGKGRKKVPSRSITWAAGASVWQTPVASLPVLEPTTVLKRLKSGGHADDLKRNCQALLNKICPENLSKIVKQFAELEINDAKDLELVISLIFKKALMEPHYSETYADMVFGLRNKYPSFPNPDIDASKHHKDSTLSFARVLVHTCQSEFERLQDEDITQIEDPEESMMRKKRCLGHMKLLGSLYLRTLLSHKVIVVVCNDLLRGEPREHFIECVCVLVRSLGFSYESEKGPEFLDTLFTKINDLIATGKYSKRLSFMIKDLKELRDDNWQQKIFKDGSAKTLKEVARTRADVFSVAGKRPEYLGMSEERFAEELTVQMKDNKELSQAYKMMFEKNLPAKQQEKIILLLAQSVLDDLQPGTNHHPTGTQVWKRVHTTHGLGRSADSSKASLVENVMRDLSVSGEILKSVAKQLTDKVTLHASPQLAAAFVSRLEKLSGQKLCGA